jgi:hypothetical protein
VPPGRDAGGTPVAIIGSGIDYTLPHLAQMLARDGEGEIVGYDFVDNDRRPFASGADTGLAEIVTGEGQTASLIAVRTSIADADKAGRAIRYAAATKTRIVLFANPVASQSHAALIASAAAHFTGQVFIVPVSNLISASQVTNFPNLIVVAAAPLGTDETAAAAAADIAAAVDGLMTGTGEQPIAQTTALSAIAAARIAALAARLQAVEPDLSPTAVKARILGLAEVLPPGTARPRLISQPRRHFWLE